MNGQFRTLAAALGQLPGAYAIAYDADSSVGLSIESLGHASTSSISEIERSTRGWLAAVDRAIAPGLIVKLHAVVDPNTDSIGSLNVPSAVLWSRTIWRLLDTAFSAIPSGTDDAAVCALIEVSSNFSPGDNEATYDVSSSLALPIYTGNKSIAPFGADALGRAITDVSARLVHHNAAWLKASGITHLTVGMAISRSIIGALNKEPPHSGTSSSSEGTS